MAGRTRGHGDSKGEGGGMLAGAVFLFCFVSFVFFLVLFTYEFLLSLLIFVFLFFCSKFILFSYLAKRAVLSVPSRVFCLLLSWLFFLSAFWLL